MAPRYCVCLRSSCTDSLLAEVLDATAVDIAIEVGDDAAPAKVMRQLASGQSDRTWPADGSRPSDRSRIIWSLRPLGDRAIGPLTRWKDVYPIDRLERFLDALQSPVAGGGTHMVMIGWTPAWNDDLGPLGGLLARRLDRDWLRIGVHTPRMDPSSTVPLIRDGLVDVVSTPFGMHDQRAAAWLLPVADDAACDVLVRGDGHVDHGSVANELALLGCDELPTQLEMTRRLASMHRSVSAVMCSPQLWKQERRRHPPAIPDQWIDQISRRLAA